jgi:hypothetical protein
MADVGEGQVVYLDDYIDLVEDAEVLSWGGFSSVRALHGRATQLLYQLDGAPARTWPKFVYWSTAVDSVRRL